MLLITWCKPIRDELWKKCTNMRQRGVRIFTKTLNCLLHFSRTPSSKYSHHTETTPPVCAATKWNSLRMIGALTESYFRADFWSNTIKLITRTNPTIKSTQKQNLDSSTIFYNELGNKSTSGKYFVKSCVCVIATGLLFSVIITFFVLLEM